MNQKNVINLYNYKLPSSSLSQTTLSLKATFPPLKLLFIQSW